jgi:hypothetical protein
MKKSFYKGVFWTLSVFAVIGVVLAIVGVVAYQGYEDVALKASYEAGKSKTTIQIKKKDITSSTNVAKIEKKTLHKKLKFTEHGPFFGIKKDGKMFRGIHIGAQNAQGNQSTWYGTFNEDEGYWKGYFLHTYADGQILYQYNEYALGSNGKIIFEDGKYEMVESYLISKESFEKVKEYIYLDMELPFSFYDFETPQTQIVKKEPTQTQKVTEGKTTLTKFTTDEKYYALVIGNNNYQYLEKLDAAENDAKVLADVLRNNYGFEVKLLLNADYDTIVNSIHNISKRVKKDENLLIFYAGHGELDKKENRGYWLPVDASYDQRSKWISNAIVVDKLKATDAKHVLLIVDSCFSGSLMRSTSKTSSNQGLGEKYLQMMKKKKTRLVITSGGKEPVMDNDGGKHSAFAKKLIGTLRENKNVIDTQRLFENVRQYVVNNTEQTPEKAVIYKAGHDGGDFLFFAKN